MTDDRSLERAARSWLETGPTQAPDRAVDAALLRIQTTPQERDLPIPLRLPKMISLVRVAAAVLVGVLAVGGALLLARPDQPAIGGPTPSPSLTATPSSSPTVPVVPSSTLVPFTSKVYPYSIEYPSNWKARDSERPIEATEFPYDYDVGVDYFSASAPSIGDPGLIVAAPVVDRSMTLDQWIANVTTLQGCSSPQASEAIQLGAQSGRLLTWNACPVFLLWATVLHADRAFDVIWIDEYADGAPALQAADKARFKTVLASFAFTTAPALSPSTGSATTPPASRTFVSPSNGYSATIPANWAVLPASARWKDGATLSWGDSVVDDLHGANVRLSVGSKPLPAGRTASGMIQTMHDETLPCDQQLPAPATIPVGDVTGTLIINGCSALSKPGAMDPRGFIYTVGAVSGGRAYYFILDGAVDPAYLEALLATVKLDPASAVN